MDLFAFQELYALANHPVGEKRLSEPITEKEITQAGISQDFETEAVLCKACVPSISS